MPIWRLEPSDLNDPNWEASSHRGPAIVRAPSEAAARETAEKAFGVKTRFAPGKGMRLTPWLRPQLVEAGVIKDTIYAEEGPDEVLEPSFVRDLPHHVRRRTKGPAGRGKITPHDPA